MPYCTKCGNKVGDWDRFCARCGSAQGAPAPAAPTPETAAGPAPTAPPPISRIRPNHAALLCYIPSVGWIASVVFLSLEPYRHDRYIRFHAFQGLFLFVVYLVARIVLAPIPVPIFPFSHFSIRKTLQLVVVIAQVIGIVRTARGADYRLPILSELAEKSMA